MQGVFNRARNNCLTRFNYAWLRGMILLGFFGCHRWRCTTAQTIHRLARHADNDSHGFLALTCGEWSLVTMAWNIKRLSLKEADRFSVIQQVFERTTGQSDAALWLGISYVR